MHQATVNSMDHRRASVMKRGQFLKVDCYARAEETASMMTQRERQQWRENAIIDFLMKTEQERQMKRERSKSKYGRMSPRRKEPTGIFGNWLQNGDGENSGYSILKKLERERKEKEQAERNARDHLKYLNRKQEEEKRSESKYGRKIAVPFKYRPSETGENMPGRCQEKPLEYDPFVLGTGSKNNR
ncbi:hypothetical protein L5515_015749 [Caenorhabditis briggsae]|uniref:Uncharacterized protein n=1 Tax=Caenorhabditis briggsae TaxID=6238 RepID=A0AAE9EJM3_CAEBR|nr:hypothetical protein L5515_015749 [Caenorhabditis briggsae]